MSFNIRSVAIAGICCTVLFGAYLACASIAESLALAMGIATCLLAAVASLLFLIVPLLVASPITFGWLVPTLFTVWQLMTTEPG
jgi:hypothetical protein